MASGDERIRFLVKGKGPAASGHFALGAGARNIAFTSQPLFRSISAAGGLAAAASPSQWFLVTAEAGVDSESPWDACHALMAQGQGVAAGGVEFVEPDLLQRWMVEPRPPGASPFALRAGELHKQNPDFPTNPANDLWFRDAQHGLRCCARCCSRSRRGQAHAHRPFRHRLRSGPSHPAGIS
jgi:hypothetical protein